ncbi:MAG: endonuclease/exonuclease/phosphatase family protein [Pseudomonadota bacterium]
MKIISLNAWGGQLYDPLDAWVSDTNPDVLCLQEVTRAPVPSPAWLHYRDPYRQLEQRSDLFGDISLLLPDHQSFFAAATRGTLFRDDATGFPSEHGLGLWVRRDLAVTHIVHDFIYGGYRHDGWGPEPVPRTMQVVRVADPSTGQAVTIGHLHGLRDPVGKGDTPTRMDQADRIIKILQSVWRQSSSCVLAGDFNLNPDSACFTALSGLGLTNMIARHHVTDTRTSFYQKEPRFADYMLVSSDLENAQFDVPASPEVSDHRPLILTL